MTVNKKDINVTAILKQALDADPSFKKGHTITIIFWVIPLIAQIMNIILSFMFAGVEYFEYFGFSQLWPVVAYVGLMVLAERGLKHVNLLPLAWGVYQVIYNVINGYFDIAIQYWGNWGTPLDVMWIIFFLGWSIITIIMMALPYLFKDCRHFMDIGNQINMGKIVKVGSASSSEDHQ